MRIKRVTGDSIVSENQPTQVSENTDAIDTVVNSSGAHAEAIEHINKAIVALSKVASQDLVAKESIANLSVVLLDLQ